jgi:hypothetical protein
MNHSDMQMQMRTAPQSIRIGFELEQTFTIHHEKSYKITCIFTYCSISQLFKNLSHFVYDHLRLEFCYQILYPTSPEPGGDVCQC